VGEGGGGGKESVGREQGFEEGCTEGIMTEFGGEYVCSGKSIQREYESKGGWEGWGKEWGGKRGM